MTRKQIVHLLKKYNLMQDLYELDKSYRNIGLTNKNALDSLVTISNITKYPVRSVIGVVTTHKKMKEYMREIKE